MNGNTLFPNFMNAVNALRECCGENAEIPPIARSEVFNETWMLRLTLALIHDYDGAFKIDDCKKKTLDAIRETVRTCWISEGGLEPALKNEGTTWTDAILGNVKRRDGTKRGVKAEESAQHVGIVMIEAKIGSPLSSKTDNHKDYDQASRNIVCLAKLVQGQSNQFVEKCRFLVIGPREKVKNWGGCKDNEEQLEQVKARLIDSKESFGDYPVEPICKNTTLISWEEVLESMWCQQQNENLATIVEFYKNVVKEADDRCLPSMDYFFKKFHVNI